MQGLEGTSSDEHFNSIIPATALKEGVRRDFLAGRFLRLHNSQVRGGDGLVVAVEVVSSGQTVCNWTADTIGFAAGLDVESEVKRGI